MSSSEVRPRQVTVGGWVALLGSVFLLLSVFGQMGNLLSLDTRESLSKLVTELGLKVSVADAVSAMRVLLYAVGAAAAAALVAAVFVLRRDKPSRVVLTAAALVLFFTGVFVDPFLAGMIAAGVTLLWGGPAGDWFAGRPIRTMPTSLPGAQALTRPSATTSSAPAAADRAMLPPTGEPSRRMRWACLLAAGASTFVGVSMLLVTAQVIADPGDIVRTQLEADPNFAALEVSLAQMKVVLVVLSLGCALWAFLAAGAAYLTHRGNQTARLLLTVSSGVAGAFALVAGLAAPPALAVAVACGLTLWGLLRP